MCAAADQSEGKGGDDFLSKLAAHKASASSSRAKHAAHRSFMAGHDDELVPASKVGQVALNSIYQSVSTGGGAATGSAAAAASEGESAANAPAGPPPGVNPNCPADSIAHNSKLHASLIHLVSSVARHQNLAQGREKTACRKDCHEEIAVKGLP